MLRLKVVQIGTGQHPSEVVVSVATADGSMEELIVDKRSILNDTLEIGYPVGHRDNRFLVELPRESLHGFWRVWVSRDSIVDEAAA